MLDAGHQVACGRWLRGRWMRPYVRYSVRRIGVHPQLNVGAPSNLSSYAPFYTRIPARRRLVRVAAPAPPARPVCPPPPSPAAAPAGPRAFDADCS
eukprot:4740227-Prymnesium_polylepis.2